MKKIIVIVFALTILFHPVFAQLKKPEPDKIGEAAIKKYKIAEIKTVILHFSDGEPQDSITYLKKYDNKGRIISEFDGGNDFQKAYVYDKNGNCTNYVCYQNGGVVVNDTMIYNERNLLAESKEYYQTVKYLYDSNDSLIRLEIFKKNTLATFTTYEYNNKHNLIKKTEYMSDSSVSTSDIYQYDSLSNLVGHQMYQGERLYYNEVYKYDEEKNMIGSTEFSLIGGDSVEYNHVFQYDSQNRLIHIISGCVKKSISTKETYEYNKQNKVTRYNKVNEYPPGKQVASSTREYFYDGVFLQRTQIYDTRKIEDARKISAIIKYYITFY